MPKSIRNYFNLQFVWNFNIIVVIFIENLYEIARSIYKERIFNLLSYGIFRNSISFYDYTKNISNFPYIKLFFLYVRCFQFDSF